MRLGILATVLVFGLAGGVSPHEEAPNADSPDPAAGRIDLPDKGLEAWEATGRREVIAVDFAVWTEAGRNPDGTPNKFNRPYREMAHAGCIGLQDHGNPVWRRNLRVRPLD